VKNIYLLLGTSLLLAAPAFSSMGDETINITLKALPPPSISPPTGPLPGHAENELSGEDAPPPPRAPEPSSRTPSSTLVGRLGVSVTAVAPIYRGRSQGGGLISRIPQGTYLAIKTEYAGWYAVLMEDGSYGWIQKRFVQTLEYNVVRRVPTPGSAFSSNTQLAGQVLREAERYLGVPYVWGGNGPHGLDCSGLVKNCFVRCGIPLPRTAHEQARVGQPVPLSLADLQPGDRLYFAVGRPSIDHTAIYMGNGYFIHASMSRHRVAIDNLSERLYGRHLVAARRL
jgi:cell wall-associated NlpC family hydrolase